MSTLVDENDLKDITVVLPEDTEIPRRKPIGWNYQNVFPSKGNGQVNGESEDESSISLKSVKPRSLSDDIEVLEVKKVKKRIQMKTIFPPSSTRKEIKDTMRGTIQAPITKYLNTKVQSDKSYPSTSSESKKANHNKILEENLQTFSKEKNECFEDKEKSLHDFSKEKDESENEKKDFHDLNEENSKEKNLYSDEKESCAENKEKILNSISEDNEICIEKNTRIIQKFSEEKGEYVRKEKILHNLHEEEKDGNEEKDGFENKENIKQDLEISSEYSISIVQKFMEKWKSIKTFGKDDEKVKDRLLKHYNVCHSSYTQSRKFINGLRKGTRFLTEENLVKFISSIIENLKRYKDEPYVEKKKKLKNASETETRNEKEKEMEKVETEQEHLDETDLKKNRKLKKIEKALVTLSEKIKKLEEEDCDWDDEDNSSYLVLHRLKQQFIKLDNLYCNIAECSSTTGRPLEKKFKFEGSRYPEINKRITTWVNKNRCFPDYMDILNLLKKVTNNLVPMKPEVVRVEAVNIFRDVGKILKERREKDDAYCIFAYADDTLEIDPADMNSELNLKLGDNEKVAKKNLDEVFQFYVEKEASKAEEERKVKDEQEIIDAKQIKENEGEDECQSDAETESKSEDFYDTEFDSEEVEESCANSDEVEESGANSEENFSECEEDTSSPLWTKGIKNSLGKVITSSPLWTKGIKNSLGKEITSSPLWTKGIKNSSGKEITSTPLWMKGIKNSLGKEEITSSPLWTKGIKNSLGKEITSSPLWTKGIKNSLGKEITFDDSDDDIQEIRDPLTPDALNINDIPDEEFDSPYEQDVEIAESPIIHVEEDEFLISKASGSIKRKDLDSDCFFSPKRRRQEREIEEIVEIDPELVEID